MQIRYHGVQFHTFITTKCLNYVESEGLFQTEEKFTKSFATRHHVLLLSSMSERAEKFSAICKSQSCINLRSNNYSLFQLAITCTYIQPVTRLEILIEAQIYCVWGAGSCFTFCTGSYANLTTDRVLTLAMLLLINI